MESNNNNSSNDKYRDFFEREDNKMNKQADHEPVSEHQSTSASYYQYGPFHSTLNDTEQLKQDTSLASLEPDRRDHIVDTPVVPATNQNRMAPVTKSARKKSPIPRMFASFMAGVLV
jgi:hypothetical protein